MSSRYVWSKANLTNVITDSSAPAGTQNVLSIELTDSDVFWSWRETSYSYMTLQNGPVYAVYGASYSIVNGKYSINNADVVTYRNGYADTATGGPTGNLQVLTTLYDYYVAFANDSSTRQFDYLYHVVAGVDDGKATYIWTKLVGAGGDGTSQTKLEADSSSVPQNNWTDDSAISRIILGKGSPLGTVSNASSGAYPVRRRAHSPRRSGPSCAKPPSSGTHSGTHGYAV